MKSRWEVAWQCRDRPADAWRARRGLDGRVTILSRAPPRWHGSVRTPRCSRGSGWCGSYGGFSKAIQGCWARGSTGSGNRQFLLAAQSPRTTGPLVDRGIVESEVAIGNPAEVLLGAARERPADLIAVGHQGIEPVRRLTLGSVSVHLLVATPVLAAHRPEVTGRRPRRARRIARSCPSPKCRDAAIIASRAECTLRDDEAPSKSRQPSGDGGRSAGVRRGLRRPVVFAGTTPAPPTRGRGRTDRSPGRRAGQSDMQGLVRVNGDRVGSGRPAFRLPGGSRPQGSPLEVGEAQGFRGDTGRAQDRQGPARHRLHRGLPPRGSSRGRGHDPRSLIVTEA